MTENKDEIVTLKVRAEDRDWVKDEQTRIRKSGKPEPSHAELFQMLRAAYESPTPVSDNPVQTSTPDISSVLPQEIREWLDLATRAVAVRDPEWREMLGNIQRQLQQVATIADREKRRAALKRRDRAGIDESGGS